MYWIVEIYRDGRWLEVGATLESTQGKAMKQFARLYPGATLRARRA